MKSHAFYLFIFFPRQSNENLDKNNDQREKI